MNAGCKILFLPKKATVWTFEEMFCATVYFYFFYKCDLALSYFIRQAIFMT